MNKVFGLEEALIEISKTKDNCSYILLALERITGMSYRIVDGKIKVILYETPRLVPEITEDGRDFSEIIKEAIDKEKNKTNHKSR